MSATLDIFDQFAAVIQVGARAVRFALDDADDEIQRYIINGSFYEADQLRYHSSLIPRNGRVLDIGANIGNHSVYYAVACHTERVISLEPNPRAARLFAQTLEWNDIPNIEFLRGIAAGATDGWALFDQTEALHHNLGGTSVNEIAEPVDGSVPVRTADSMLAGREVDFIKIDVEGSELRVLAGLHETITAQLPIIAVEIMPQSRSAFMQWCSTNRYRIERTFHMYRGIVNYVCLPIYS